MCSSISKMSVHLESQLCRNAYSSTTYPPSIEYFQWLQKTVISCALYDLKWHSRSSGQRKDIWSTYRRDSSSCFETINCSLRAAQDIQDYNGTYLVINNILLYVSNPPANIHIIANVYHPIMCSQFPLILVFPLWGSLR